MISKEKTKITVEAVINAGIERVWEYWTSSKHIIRWNNASKDWHTSFAENDLRPGGKFLSRMEARDGSIGFDFTGTYDKIEKHKYIKYTMEDNRVVEIYFTEKEDSVVVKEVFEAENSNSVQMQKDGWQSILNNFKKYVENQNMDNIEFDILIDAPVTKVYSDMLDPEKYKAWTAIFNPTSHYIGFWEKGSKIHFIGSDEKGNEGGMVSLIKENIPNKFVSIEHIGVLKDGKEVLEGEEVEAWAGGLENYLFLAEGNKTRLKIEMDSNAEFKTYFEETWPKALHKLKEICETR